MNRQIFSTTFFYLMLCFKIDVALAGNATEAMQVLEQQLKQAGIYACKTKIMALSKYLIASDDVNFVLHPIGPANNGSLTITIANSNSNGLGLSIWTLFVSQNICSGTYEQINHWDSSCADVKKQSFSSFGLPKILISDISQSELNPLTYAYFIPSRFNGCTTVKKELLP